MVRSSRLPGFHKLPLAERLARVAELAGLTADERAVLAEADGQALDRADRMIENVIAVYDLPVGVAVNFRIDGRDRLVPMSVEEPSIVAAASYAAKLLRGGDGIVTRATDPVMIAQIQLLDVPDADAAVAALEAAAQDLCEAADATQPRLVGRGGGTRGLEVRRFDDTEVGPMVVAHLLVDVCDSMGANLVNQVAEVLAPRCEALTGGRAHLRILSNLADRRLVEVVGRVPTAALALPEHGWSGERVADRIVEASVLAERDPYRAATHNKGIMNGVDAVLVATGQDFRAVEAGAHAYAARGGTYGALATWRREGEALVGRMTLPMAVGVVGGVTRVHPVVQVMLTIAEAGTATELGRIAAAAGLAQNLAALRALTTEGIQRGHMSLHARNIAAATGARDEVLDRIVREMIRRRTFSPTAAEALLEAEQSRDREQRAARVQAALADLARLRDTWWPRIEGHIETVLPPSDDEESLEHIAHYQLRTGGKRLRPMLALMVQDALGGVPETATPFAAAVELLHNGTLIHDDAEVRARLRRGRPAVWARYGLDQAITVGDGLFFAALRCAEALDLPPRRAQSLQRLITDTMLSIIRAEVRHPEPWSDAWVTRAGARTGGLFALSLAGSALLAGASEATQTTLTDIAGHVGVVFQAQDALLSPSDGDDVAPERAVEVIETHRAAVHHLAATLEDPVLADLMTALADALLAPLYRAPGPPAT